jgi:hypothetical protein
VDGRRITLDGGVVLLATAERALGGADSFGALVGGPGDPIPVTHSVANSLQARMLGIACGDQLPRGLAGNFNLKKVGAMTSSTANKFSPRIRPMRTGWCKSRRRAPLSLTGDPSSVGEAAVHA